MTIASEIARLQGVKSNILAAIEAKNVIVPPGAALADCPDLIAAITGVGEISFSMKPIVPVSGNKFIICDDNGNIGYECLPVYDPSAYTSYAVVVDGANFSGAGLGTVTFLGVADIGGRTYRTVTINGVTWLAENLDYKASEIAIGPDGSPSTPAAWYYNNSEATYGVNGNKYGLLYNWHAVKHLNDNRVTLMPGWHVPTKGEWDALANAVGGSGDAGTKLKANSGWDSGNGSDDFGFSVFPAGTRYSGSFYNVGGDTHFWTATETSSTLAYNYGFSTGASMDLNNNNKTNNAYSVRLVKDS